MKSNNPISHLSKTSSISQETTQKGGPCVNCECARENGAKFCPGCGSALDQSQEKQPIIPSSEEIITIPEQPIHQTSTITQNTSPQISLQNTPEKEATTHQEQQEEPNPPRTCQFCGEQLPASYLFCFSCGNPSSKLPKKYSVTVTTEDGKSFTTIMNKNELSIGKISENDVILDHDSYASRRHAKIFESNDMVFLEDAGSANGTFLRVRRPIVLESGDEILVGTSVIRFEEDTTPAISRRP